MSYLYIMTVAAVIMLLSQLILHNIIKMLSDTDKKLCIAVNYRGRAIPAIGGIAFIPILMSTILLLLMQGTGNSRSYLSYLALVLCMGLAGVVDDLVGDTKTKGLINHIKSTLHGRMTTGFLKAFIGFIMSCIVSFGMSGSYIELIVNALIISLFANTLNLFDLRPGRAVKVFLGISLLLLTAAIERLTEAIPLLILNSAALLYIRYDLREICMLGDTGANILGISLGYYCALALGFNIKLPVLLMLIILNAVSEKLSISELINKSRLFSYLDNLGRGRAGDR